MLRSYFNISNRKFNQVRCSSCYESARRLLSGCTAMASLHNLKKNNQLFIYKPLPLLLSLERYKTYRQQNHLREAMNGFTPCSYRRSDVIVCFRLAVSVFIHLLHLFLFFLCHCITVSFILLILGFPLSHLPDGVHSTPCLACLFSAIL